MAEKAQRRGIEYVVIGPGDDLHRLAEEAVDRGADALGVAGGDGSQAVAAQVAMERDLAFVCVPWFSMVPTTSPRTLGSDRGRGWTTAFWASSQPRREKAMTISSSLRRGGRSGPTPRMDGSSGRLLNSKCDRVGSIPAGVDGEAIVFAPSLRFRCLPRALRVRVPAGTSRPRRD